MAERGCAHVGTSGWSYRHWIGPFYPEGTRSADMLATYAGTFNASEVNNTFYTMPNADTLAGWRDEVPEGFVFAVKANRYITHMKKLKDPDQSTPGFFDAVRVLGDRLGPILFQLPPNMGLNLGRLRAFLEALPAGHRYAFEFRNSAWFDDSVVDLLGRHGAALVGADTGGETSPLVATGPFVYLRLHGPGDEPYTGCYDEAALDAWAERVRGWLAEGRDAYVFFDNDERGHAARNARDVQRRLMAG